MICVGVDPGKKGYACRLSAGAADDHAFEFHPAAVTEGEDADGPPEYDVEKMIWTTRSWANGPGVQWGAQIVVLERQAPQRRGTSKEGTWSSWSNGFGFGLWTAALVAAGFKRCDETQVPAEGGVYVVVDPQVWKRRMGAIATHRGEDSKHARRKSADEASIRAARAVAPQVDLRPLERAPGARTPSPDKACSLLMAVYAMALLKKAQVKGEIQ